MDMNRHRIYQNPYLEYLRITRLESDQRERQRQQPRAPCECDGSGYHKIVDFYGIARRIYCAGCRWAEIERNP